MLLEYPGFKVLTVPDGRSALEVSKQSADEIVCVILDLTMPHMDGEECSRELRRLNKDVRVMMSSGYTEHDIQERFAGKGLAGFVQKPYTKDEFEKALKQALPL